MELEWDEAKRRWNLETRGLDFADIASMEQETVRTLPDRRRNYGEARFNSFGILNGRLCTFCWTPRNGRVRIISLRKANARERETYDKQASNAR